MQDPGIHRGQSPAPPQLEPKGPAGQDWRLPPALCPSEASSALILEAPRVAVRARLPARLSPGSSWQRAPSMPSPPRGPPGNACPASCWRLPQAPAYPLKTGQTCVSPVMGAVASSPTHRKDASPSVSLRSASWGCPTLRAPYGLLLAAIPSVPPGSVHPAAALGTDPEVSVLPPAKFLPGA